MFGFDGRVKEQLPHKHFGQVSVDELSVKVNQHSTKSTMKEKNH